MTCNVHSCGCGARWDEENDALYPPAVWTVDERRLAMVRDALKRRSQRHGYPYITHDGLLEARWGDELVEVIRRRGAYRIVERAS